MSQYKQVNRNHKKRREHTNTERNKAHRVNKSSSNSSYRIVSQENLEEQLKLAQKEKSNNNSSTFPVGSLYKENARRNNNRGKARRRGRGYINNKNNDNKWKTQHQKNNTHITNECDQICNECKTSNYSASHKCRNCNRRKTPTNQTSSYHDNEKTVNTPTINQRNKWKQIQKTHKVDEKQNVDNDKKAHNVNENLRVEREKSKSERAELNQKQKEFETEKSRIINYEKEKYRKKAAEMKNEYEELRRKIYLVTWELKYDDGEWEIYDDTLNKRIDRLAINKSLIFKGNDGDNYLITRYSKISGVEQNIDTNICREIRRKEEQTEKLKRLKVEAEKAKLDKEKTGIELENRRLKNEIFQLRQSEKQKEAIQKQYDLLEQEKLKAIKYQKNVELKNENLKNEILKLINQRDAVSAYLTSKVEKSVVEKLEIMKEKEILKKENGEFKCKVEEFVKLLNEKSQEGEKYRLKAEEIKKSLELMIWQVNESDGEWKSFDDEMNKKIEALAINESFPFTCNGKTCKITRNSNEFGQQIIVNGFWVKNDKQEIRRIKKSYQLVTAELDEEKQEFEMEKVRINKEKEQLRKKAEDEEKQKLEKEQEYEKLKKNLFVVIWEWRENNGEWKLYTDSMNTKIEILEINQTLKFTAKNNQTYEVTRNSKNGGLQKKYKDKCSERN
eukprot:333971_1